MKEYATREEKIDAMVEMLTNFNMLERFYVLSRCGKIDGVTEAIQKMKEQGKLYA